ncbi:MAG: glycosyltransferase family 2 protein [Boseongicola sp.]
MQLSIVVPCMNEEPVLGSLVQRLRQAVEPWKEDYEIVLVDDGSTDNTWEEIARAAEQAPMVRGLRLSANRGHQLALTAGLEAAKGDRIFMLDADLQDPPELLSDMMAMMDRGYDVVYGRRTKREGEKILKRFTAFVFYRTLNYLSESDIPKDTGDFRLVSRRALDAVLSMPERARFIRGMFSWAGFRQIGVEYVRNERFAGETKYGWSQMIQFALDGVTGFSIRPLRLATRLSIFSLIITFLMAVYVFGSLIFFQAAAGWASTLLAVSFFSSIQLLTLGIMGEYIGRLYIEAKGRPLYYIADEVGGGVRQKDSV